MIHTHTHTIIRQRSNIWIDQTFSWSRAFSSRESYSHGFHQKWHNIDTNWFSFKIISLLFFLCLNCATKYDCPWFVAYKEKKNIKYMICAWKMKLRGRNKWGTRNILLVIESKHDMLTMFLFLFTYIFGQITNISNWTKETTWFSNEVIFCVNIIGFKSHRDDSESFNLSQLIILIFGSFIFKKKLFQLNFIPEIPDEVWIKKILFG